MIASGLLYFRRCCALRLEGKSQVGVTPICVCSDGRIMPYCTIFSQLPTLLVLAGMHPVRRVGSLSESFVQQRCLLLNNLFIMD
jgi:hypothetical protein